eukprot:4220099-Amphidinium_carterae.1
MSASALGSNRPPTWSRPCQQEKLAIHQPALATAAAAACASSKQLYIASELRVVNALLCVCARRKQNEQMNKTNLRH